jgi:hypothetical protein
VVVVRRDHFISREVVSRDAFSLGMLLGSSRSRIEKIVDRLESSPTLSRHFLVLVGERIL